MVLAKHQCPCGRTTSPTCCHQCLYPQGEVQLPPASPRPAGGLTQAFFKFLLLPCIPECVRLCGPFKSGGLYFPQPSGSPQIKHCWPSKPNVPGACLPSSGPPGWGARYRAQTPCSLGRTSASVMILPFAGRPPGDVGLD